MRITHFLLLGLILLCFGCNNATQPSAAKKTEKGTLATNLSQQGTTKMMGLVTKYYALKNALVASDAAKTTELNEQLMTDAKDMISFLSADSADKSKLQPYVGTVLMGTQIIAAIQDPTCEKQRLAFSGISAAMFAMLKSADLKNGGVYKQYCPMAFNDKGAYWLSAEEEIRNPYFGKKMLECGEVQDSL